MGTAMASMASGQQAGSSRERSDVADLEKQLVPLIRKWWDERIRHHEQHWSFNHPNTLLRNKNTPFLFLKSHLLSMVPSVTFHGVIRCYAKRPRFSTEVREQCAPIPRMNSWSGTERRLESSPELQESRRLREPGGVLAVEGLQILGYRGTLQGTNTPHCGKGRIIDSKCLEMGIC